MNDLIDLAMTEIASLGQKAMEIHCELEKWRETPWTMAERCDLSMKLKLSLEHQYKWISAVHEDLLEAKQ